VPVRTKAKACIACSGRKGQCPFSSGMPGVRVPRSRQKAGPAILGPELQTSVHRFADGMDRAATALEAIQALLDKMLEEMKKRKDEEEEDEESGEEDKESKESEKDGEKGEKSGGA
jgi:hypothetical protein